jgi:hypothetical protein
VIGSLTLLIMIVGYGPYSPNLIDNLNPPTCCLLLLGVVHGLALTLAAPALDRLARRPVISRVVDAVNERAMTIYLWHMSVLVTIALIILAAGLPLPTPLSPAWWGTRGYWLLAIGVGMIIAARALGRFERGRSRPRREAGPSTGSGSVGPRLGSLPIMVGAVLIAIVAVGVVLVAGFSVLSATLATLGLAAALRLTRGPRAHGRMITAAA